MYDPKVCEDSRGLPGFPAMGYVHKGNLGWRAQVGIPVEPNRTELILEIIMKLWDQDRSCGTGFELSGGIDFIFLSADPDLIFLEVVK